MCFLSDIRGVRGGETLNIKCGGREHEDCGRAGVAIVWGGCGGVHALTLTSCYFWHNEVIKKSALVVHWERRRRES